MLETCNYDTGNTYALRSIIKDWLFKKVYEGLLIIKKYKLVVIFLVEITSEKIHVKTLQCLHYVYEH